MEVVKTVDVELEPVTIGDVTEVTEAGGGNTPDGDTVVWGT